MARDAIGSTMSVDISELRKNLEIANRLIKSNESNWLASADAMEDWTKSETGLKKRMDVLSKTIDTQQKAVDEIIATKEEAIKQYGEESDEVAKINKYLITHSKNLQKSKQEYSKLEKALESMTEEEKDANEEIKDTTKESKKASKELDNLSDSAKDTEGGFTIAKGAIAGFIANGLTAMVSAIGGAVSSLMGLTESTLEYRREMGRITTVAEQVGVSGDRIIDKWMDVNAVIQDDSSVTEGLNNLMTAGFTAEKQLDAITKGLEGASIQWAETLKFEGLSDSLQEWIGSDGASLTGQFAELLERLGYNLDDVTEATKGMTDEQRRNWAIQTLQKNGLMDVSDAYREANADMIAFNKANADLTHAQAQLGEQMQPLVTTIKQSTADILYSFTDLFNDVEGAGDQLIYNVGYFAGEMYQSVKNVVDKIAPLVADAIPQLVGFIEDELPNFLAQGTAMIQSIIDGASQKIPEVLSGATGLVTSIIDTLLGSSTDLLNSAITLFGAIVDAIPSVIEELTIEVPKIIDNVISRLFEGEDSVLSTATEVLGKIVDAIPAVVTMLGERLPDIINEIAGSLTDAMPTILENAKNLLRKVIEAIPTVVAELGESLPQIINSILQFLIDNAPAILEGATDMLLEIINAIPTVVASLGGALWDIITTITGFFADNAGEIWNIGVDIVQGIIDGIKSMFNAIKNVGKWIYDKTIGAVLDFFGINSPSTQMRDKVGKNIVSGMVEGIKSMLSSITSAGRWIFDNTIGKIKGLFDGSSDLINIGKNVVNGVVDGITSMKNAVENSANWIYDNTVGRVKKWLGIASPSKVMRDEVGVYISEGLAVGIKDGEHYVADSAEELVREGIRVIKEEMDSVTDAGENVANSFSQGFEDALNGTKRDMSKAVEGAVTEASETVASSTPKKLEETITTAVKKATTDYSRYVDSATDIFSVLKEGDTEENPNAVMDSLFSTAGQFGGIWGALADSIWNFLSETIIGKDEEEIREIASNMVNNLLNAVLELLTNLPQIVSGAIEFMKTFAIGLIQGVPELIKAIPQMISEMVTALISDGIPALFEVGIELIKGLIEGMFSINLWDIIKGIGGGIINGFKKFFGISSPSKMMADEVGKNLALGIEEGITDNLVGVNAALRKGVDTSLQFDGVQRKQVNVYQTNNYSQAHSRYELYKSKHDTANAVKLALQGV